MSITESKLSLPMLRRTGVVNGVHPLALGVLETDGAAHGFPVPFAQ